MLRYVQYLVIPAVSLVVLSSSVQAKDDGDDDHELRIRQNQLVITNAAADCDADPDVLRIRGTNFGKYPPHVTLGLMPLMVTTFDPELEPGLVTVALPRGLCDTDPGSKLLTLMRTRYCQELWISGPRDQAASFRSPSLFRSFCTPSRKTTPARTNGNR